MQLFNSGSTCQLVTLLSTLLRAAAQAAAAAASSMQTGRSCSPAQAAGRPSTAVTHAGSSTTPHTRQSAGAQGQPHDTLFSPAIIQQQHACMHVLAVCLPSAAMSVRANTFGGLNPCKLPLFAPPSAADSSGTNTIGACRALCRFRSTGRWHAAGIRPSEDCWVMNRAMTAARRLLQQQHKHLSSSTCSRPGTAHAASAQRNEPGKNSSNKVRRSRSVQPGSRNRLCAEGFTGQPSGCYQQEEAEHDWQRQLQQQLEAVRLQEQREVAAQQQVELRASQGLDGPRPCLCSNGKEKLAGWGPAAAVRKTGSSSGGVCGRLSWSAVGRSSSGSAQRNSKAWKGVHEA